MSKLFDGNDSDSDIDIKTNNEYAKNYNVWRQKEELNKLKTVYGDDPTAYEEQSDSSSSEDEDAKELTEEVEKDFFKTLACLKNKDPRIYDNNVNFFNKSETNTESKTKSKAKSDKPHTLRDHERRLLLEGEEEENEEDLQRPASPTFVEEQNRIRESLLKIVHSDDDNENESEDFGGIFRKREKTKEDKEKEEEEYRQWLAGRKDKLEDKNQESDLKPLKEYWNNPELDANETFLRDYLLNKRFLDAEDESYIPSYEEIVHDSDENLSEDERNIEQQEEFEHKYNFRFEEPDQEFLKRYPRTMENSVRRKDDKRKQKRAELKERKAEERARKDEELKQLKAMKRKEIEAKIQQLREITGNQEIGFQDEDVDGDFDPEAHDARMQQLFNNEFYSVDEGDQKPVFPEDEELMGDDWDNWKGEDENVEDHVPHCEDDDFIMDCDYDPATKLARKAETQSMLIENSGAKKKRRRKSKFAEVLSQKKPVFDPNDKSYEQYLDEYYKLDYEDIIGDQPCRFKYKRVAPNSFGLTIEEILSAKDKELNSWCSLKKAVQIRPDHVEKYEQIAYERKGKNEALKRKTLKSLYQEPEPETNIENSEIVQNEIVSKKRKRDQGNETSIDEKDNQDQEQNTCTENSLKDGANESKKLTKNQKKKMKKNKELQSSVTSDSGEGKMSKLDENHKKEIEPETIDNKVSEDDSKKNNKTKIEKTPTNQTKKLKNAGKIEPTGEKSSIPEETQIIKKNKEKSRVKKNGKNMLLHVNKNSKNKVIKKLKTKQNKADIDLSESRLRAYGINPKKFKNKQKFKSQ